MLIIIIVIIVINHWKRIWDQVTLVLILNIIITLEDIIKINISVDGGKPSKSCHFAPSPYGRMSFQVPSRPGAGQPFWDRGYSEPDSVPRGLLGILCLAIQGTWQPYLSVSQGHGYQRGERGKIWKETPQASQAWKESPFQARWNSWPSLPCSRPKNSLGPWKALGLWPFWSYYSQLYCHEEFLTKQRRRSKQDSTLLRKSLPCPLSFPLSKADQQLQWGCYTCSLSGNSVVMTIKPHSSNANASCGHFLRKSGGFIYRSCLDVDEMQYLWSAVKQSTVKTGMPVFIQKEKTNLKRYMNPYVHYSII